MKHAKSWFIFHLKYYAYLVDRRANRAELLRRHTARLHDGVKDHTIVDLRTQGEDDEEERIARTWNIMIYGFSESISSTE